VSGHTLGGLASWGRLERLERLVGEIEVGKRRRLFD
jgi:hypothetical protein